MMLTKQAWILAIVYILSTIIGLIMTIKARAFNAFSFIGLLFSLGFIALLVYDTQCLTSGNCTVWSWIRTILYVFFPTIGLIATAFALFSGKKPSPQVTSMTHVTPTVTRPPPPPPKKRSEL